MSSKRSPEEESEKSGIAQMRLNPAKRLPDKIPKHITCQAKSAAVGLGLFLAISEEPTFLSAPPADPVKRSKRSTHRDSCRTDPTVRLRPKHPPSLKNELCRT
jgi:hypothetical protein